MVPKKPTVKGEFTVSSSIEEMLLAAMERGDESMQTGRFLVTFQEGAFDEGINMFKTQGLRVADAREFSDQAVTLEVGDADALVLPEIGVAVAGAATMREQLKMSMEEALPAEGPVAAIEPEYFAYAWDNEYLRGFASAANTIARDMGVQPELERGEEEVEVLGVTWGLVACRVPQSRFSGRGIKLAVLDTGMDLRHPDFAGRSITPATFVNQPVQDLHGHGTHVTGTSSGPLAPFGKTPRYGIAYSDMIFIGKVLQNNGWSVGGSVLAGMNWAIANRCEVINMSLGGASPVQAAYTQAGQAALNKGLLIIAAAGNDGSQTGAPANSPTIMAVAALDHNLRRCYFSNFGKIEIAAPGCPDIFSSFPMPRRYYNYQGTSQAAPHVAGCAALWAQTSPSLRGISLWRKLQATARRLPYPATLVGSGLVQAP